jgi:hypothetical protein
MRPSLYSRVLRSTFWTSMVVALMALTLSAAPSKQQQCKNSCDISYHFCVQHAFNKFGKKQCAATRATCKRGCPVLR